MPAKAPHVTIENRRMLRALNRLIIRLIIVPLNPKFNPLNRFTDTDLEKRLWSAADEFRANSKLKSSEYSVPVLGLIFLRYADHKFAQATAKLTSQGSERRTIGERKR